MADEYKVIENLTLEEAVEKAGDTGSVTRSDWTCNWTVEALRLDAVNIRSRAALDSNWKANIPVKTYTAAEALELPYGTKLQGPYGAVFVFGTPGNPLLTWADRGHTVVAINSTNLAGPYRIVEDGNG